MGMKFDNRQSRQRSVLDQLSNSTNLKLDNILNLVNDELSMPLRMRVTSGTIITVDNINVTTQDSGEGHGRNRTLPPIQNVIPAWTTGTITISGNGATGIATPSAGSPTSAFGMSANQFMKIGVCLDKTANLVLIKGTPAASIAAAGQPRKKSGTIFVGHFVVATNGSNSLLALTDNYIYQYVGGGGSGGAEAIPQTLLNNQYNQNVVDLSLLSSDNKAAKVEYSVVRNQTGGTGATHTSFVTNAISSNKFNADVNKLVAQSDGKIIVGGAFTNYAGTSGRDCLVRLNSDGTLDTAFCTNASDSSKFGSTVYAIATQSDGKILVGGAFTNYAGTAGRNRLIRLNSDGTLDTAFCANASDSTKFNGIVYAVAVQSDGKILVGGGFIDYLTAFRHRLIRLNSDGTLDTAFCANASDLSKLSSTVNTISITPSGGIMIGGAFLNYGTPGLSYFALLNSDGTTNSSVSNAISGSSKINAGVVATFATNNGDMYVGGAFTDYNGTVGRNRLLRFNSLGTLDTSFCTNAIDSGKFLDLFVNGVFVQENGSVMVSGNFSAYNGNTNYANFVKLNNDGTLDTTFMTAISANFNNGCNTSITTTNDVHLIGGYFTNYDSVSGDNRLIKIFTTPNTDYVEQGSFSLRYKNLSSTWMLDGQTYTGDITGVSFSVTSGGQVQYSSTDMPSVSTQQFELKWILTPL